MFQHITLWTLITWISATSITAQAYRTVGNPRAPEKGRITELLYAEPSSLNPLEIQDHSASLILSKLFDTLQVQNPRTGAWEPSIASQTTVSEAESSVTFQIRSGVLFHDGHPLLPADVRFTLQSFKERSPSLRSLLQDIVAIEDVPPSSIRVRFKSYRPELIDLVSTLPILPKHLYENATPARAIGSGPYLVDENVPGDRLVLKRFPHWFGAKVWHFRGVANFSEWRFKFVARSELDTNPFETQSADLIRFSSLAGLRALASDGLPKEGWELLAPEQSPSRSHYQIRWNPSQSTLSDTRVREAIALGSPVERLVQDWYGSFVTSRAPQSDLIRARSLIHASGILRTNSQNITPRIEVLVTNDIEAAFIERLYRASVRELGIAIRAVQVSPQEFTRRLESQQYMGALVGVDIEPENALSKAPLETRAPFDILPLFEAPAERVAVRQSVRHMDPPFETALGELYFWSADSDS